MKRPFRLGNNAALVVVASKRKQNAVMEGMLKPRIFE